jgi:hypothetical protein
MNTDAHYMKILVVYLQFEKRQRNTISEHLYSFQRYGKGEFFYLNALGGIPSFIKQMKFDAIIFHYTFLAMKWNGPHHFSKLLEEARPIAEMKALKIAFPQDEYIYSKQMSDFFRDFGVDVVYTCLPLSEVGKVYKNSGVAHFKQTLTGYVEEGALDSVIKKYYRPHSERSLDLGYRARLLPFWLGKLGTFKWRLTEIFAEASARHGLQTDLSNDETKVFHGEAWYEFLCRSRAVLGSESGASLLDENGKLRARVEDYCANHPGANFEEVERACFPGLDGNLNLHVVSPRHFEAAMSRTTQVMIEGDYSGIFIPDVHYIPIKKDFSNIDEVVSKIKDIRYCEAMAERTYQDIIQSRRLTYRVFVEEMMTFVSSLRKERVQPSPAYAVTLVRTYETFWCAIKRIEYRLKVFLYPKIKDTFLFTLYRKAREA